MSHLEHLSILTDKQHGFRPKHSCTTQLIQTVHDLAHSLDKRKQNDVIIMDFSKAFDVVPHNRLLLKLDHFGIRSNTHHWISNFLTQRNQRVVVGGDHSNWVPVQSGVPQGTVLGPLLFLLFINDLPDEIVSNVRLFADDCVIYREIVNDFDAQVLQNDLDISTEFGLEQMVTEPTRINNILDLFLTSNPTLVESSKVIPGMSDHDGIPMLIISSKPKLNKQKPHKVFSYHKADVQSIKSDLNEFGSNFLAKYHSSGSVDDMYSEFEGKSRSVMDAHIPARMVSKKNLTPWINGSIKRMHRRKQRAFNHWRNRPSNDSLEKFQKQRKATHRATRKSYRDYINSICLDSPKRFWSYIKSLKNDSTGIPSLRKNGKLHSDNIQKANILNNQFKDVFTLEKDFLPPETHTDTPSMSDFSISVDGVYKLLKDLNPHKASGPDGIPAKILKMAATEVAPILSLIFQKSLDTGILPSPWLCANISPIFKKGDRSVASNYRPVSLTSICCKTLEHIIHTQIMHHFDTHSIITDRQHGFRKHHSCESQLILTVNDLVLSLNNRSQTDLIILDFSKAFDTVPHNRLLQKLKRYGINTKMLTWIANFLKHRKQRVVVGGEHSAWTDVISGVPQGTVLGPLLFLVYINDLPQNISSEVRLVADDCAMYREIHNNFDQDQLQDDLDKLAQWQDEWQMQFNIKKCFVMRITHIRKPKLYEYKLGSHTLEETSCHAYLGVDITNNLNWNKHISRIPSSANRSLGFIKRNLYSCTKPIKETAYCSLVRPLLEYSSAVWDPYTKDLTNKIESIQRRAARFVANDYKYTSNVSDMIKDLNWSSLKDRRTISRLSILHKARQDLLALPVNDLLQPVQRLSRHVHSNCYKIIPSNKDCHKYSYLPQTVKDWNGLPYSTTLIEDPKKFKAAVATHLNQQD